MILSKTLLLGLLFSLFSSLIHTTSSFTRFSHPRRIVRKLLSLSNDQGCGVNSSYLGVAAALEVDPEEEMVRKILDVHPYLELTDDNKVPQEGRMRSKERGIADKVLSVLSEKHESNRGGSSLLGAVDYRVLSRFLNRTKQSLHLFYPMTIGDQEMNRFMQGLREHADVDWDGICARLAHPARVYEAHFDSIHFETEQDILLLAKYELFGWNHLEFITKAFFRGRHPTEIAMRIKSPEIGRLKTVFAQLNTNVSECFNNLTMRRKVSKFRQLYEDVFKLDKFLKHQRFDEHDLKQVQEKFAVLKHQILRNQRDKNSESSSNNMTISDIELLIERVSILSKLAHIMHRSELMYRQNMLILEKMELLSKKAAIKEELEMIDQELDLDETGVDDHDHGEDDDDDNDEDDEDDDVDDDNDDDEDDEDDDDIDDDKNEIKRGKKHKNEKKVKFDDKIKVSNVSDVMENQNQLMKLKKQKLKELGDLQDKEQKDEDDKIKDFFQFNDDDDDGDYEDDGGDHEEPVIEEGEEEGENVKGSISVRKAKCVRESRPPLGLFEEDGVRNSPERMRMLKARKTDLYYALYASDRELKKMISQELDLGERN